MKRIVIALLLVLVLALPAWGVARTLYPAQDAMNWSAAEWSLADDNAKNQAKPAGGDTVYFSANSGDVTLDENSAALAALAMDAAGDYVGTLALGANTLTVDGNCYLVGAITGTGTIDAGEGTFDNDATVADGVTLLLTTSGSDNIGWGGTGGSVNINATGTYTLTTDCDSYALTLTAGTLAGGAQTWTVGAGGCTMAGGTLSGTLTISLASGSINCTGAVTLADGADITADFTGAGGTIALAAGATATINGNVTQGAVGAAFLTIAAGQTFTLNGTVSSGSVASAHGVYITGGTATVTTATGGSGASARGVYITGGTATVTTATGGSANNAMGVFVGGGAATVTTATGGSAATASGVFIYSGTVTIDDVVASASANGLYPYGGTSTVNKTTSGSYVLGPNTATASGATLTLAVGTHAVSTIAEGNAANVGNALNLQGRLILSGTFTGTGITVTPTYEGVIDCGGTGRVTAVTATGRRLVVRRAVDAAGSPVRSWEGDSCTNVRFLGGRKVIGVPGVN